MSDQPKPVLWVACTAAGRSPNEMGGQAKPDPEAMEDIKQKLEEELGDSYEIVVADDKLRLLDASEVRELLQDLTEQAQQFAHEDALFTAAGGDELPEDDSAAGGGGD